MSRRKRLLPIRDVCTRHSGRMAIHGNSIVASGGRTPTMVAVPRMARLSMACRTSVALPTASNAWSTPAPFVSARTALTGSSLALLTTWVAPTRLAISSFPSNTSTPMICRAPPMRAPCTMATSTPPAPSWPSTMGRSVGQRPWPSTTCRSLWQTPVAAVRTRTSRPDGLSISTDSIVRGSCGLRKTAAFISMARSSLRQLPAEPVADRAAHDQLLVAARQPRQLLREHRHALPPRARHARDVGAPEHPRGAEGVVDPPQVTVDVAIGIGLARVARRAGGLDGHVRVLRQREHVAEIAPGRVVLRVRRSPEVIDDQLECRMLHGDLGDLRQEIGGEQRHRDSRALCRGRHPVDGAVGRPRLLVRLQEREAQAEHARTLLPAVDQRAALRLVERKVPEDREPVGMLARRLDGQLVGVRVPFRRRMDDGGIDARGVHLLQQIVFGEARDLPVV